ncbi:hypothetical protein Ahy_B04g073449 [Arachis hypogaea]|uniref:Uncharacterized protein n=1 Tax=Arachis hypogaea TaxID=3818 RepID=A0A444ZQF6_ARAHY|nr:hypothetical protein Ahy_B04g073449 [Arachis hypogaea]
MQRASREGFGIFGTERINRLSLLMSRDNLALHIPQIGTRSTLWRELENIAATNQALWCLGGNLNSIISLEETGGSFNLSQDSNRFQECMLNYGLNNLGFFGPPFSWQRN